MCWGGHLDGFRSDTEILENNVHLTDIIEHLVQQLLTGFAPPFEIIIILFYFFSSLFYDDRPEQKMND